MSKLSGFLRNIGRPIAFYPQLTKITGRATATILFCQLFYWEDKGTLGDGWIYKTSQEIEQETGLSYTEQHGARQVLVKLGILIEKYDRLNHRMLFKIDKERLDDIWEEHESTSENITSPIDKPSVPELIKHKMGNKEIINSLSTETTHRLPENTPSPQKSAGELVSTQENCEELEEGQEVCTEKTELEETIMQDKDQDPKVEKTKQRIEAALIGASPYMDASGLNVLNLDAYPEEVRPIVARVCQLWRLKPPTRGKKGGEFARWIDDARALKDACGEFGTRALEATRADFKAYMETHQGLPPFTVSGPGSLVKTCRAKAGELRQRQDSGTETVTRKGGGFYA